MPGASSPLIKVVFLGEKRWWLARKARKNRGELLWSYEEAKGYGRINLNRSMSIFRDKGE